MRLTFELDFAFKLPLKLPLTDFSLLGLDSDAKQNYRPSFMDHFDRIFEGGGRGTDSAPLSPSDEDACGHLRGAKHEDPFKIKKAGPPDFEFVSKLHSMRLLLDLAMT